jgi:type II secretory pathway pseudopilin PulG
MFRRFRSIRGFSAAETTIVLSTVSILAAATAPALGDYVSDARQSRARDEVRVIATALSRMSDDVLSRADVTGGIGTLQLVVSDGDMPALASGVDARWATSAATSGVGSLNDHLVSNVIGYPAAGTTGLPAGIKGWHGPYVDRAIGPDPWGRRYAVRFGRGTSATVVLSAGQDGVISTVDTANGLIPGGDDIMSVVAGR